jgi:FkbM family methyltransferase
VQRQSAIQEGQCLVSRSRNWIQLPRGLGKGLWLKVNLTSERGYARGIAEPGVLKYFAQYLGKGDCFYDVGAHIGFYSLIAARIVGPNGLVVAFEPEVANYRLLRENCSKNGLSVVHPVPTAVWSRNMRVLFERGPDSSAMTGHVIETSPYRQTSRTLYSQAISLDRFCKSRRPPTFLKVDVEGGEIEVLEGAQDLLRKYRPTLIVEVHRRRYLATIARLLGRLGYSELYISKKPTKTLVLYSPATRTPAVST